MIGMVSAKTFSRYGNTSSVTFSHNHFTCKYSWCLCLSNKTENSKVSRSEKIPVADPGFPRGEGANSRGGRQHTILPNFSKTACNWKNLDRGACVPRTPLKSATEFHLLARMGWYHNVHNATKIRLTLLICFVRCGWLDPFFTHL